ncbi:tRNA (guanine(10)-N(2))-dimethyltransferase [Candidatus Bathyarchaeota archaeon]|nr:tRNA (guanine(10)-N(2))-dimethyltransferase [Candidatus Bathyarchaeota archaeon]
MDFDFPVESIREGLANVVIPRLEAFKRGGWDYAPCRAPVFYNPLMKTCRDIAVLALQSYQKIVSREIRVSEPLTGCGVRGIRFAMEVSGVDKVYINDINKNAYKLAQYNVRLNGLENKVFVSNEDANLFLSRNSSPEKRFDFIDIDPFGTPVPFIDSAVRALRDGGMLALTATDLAPLCGVYPKVALRKYGGKSLRTEYCHEIAIRLLAGCLAVMAAKHEIGIKILFSHSTNHYVRLYSVISYGARKADESLGEIGYILHCPKCLHREVHPDMFLSGSEIKCRECGSKLKFAGPLWVGKILDAEYCRKIEENLGKFEYFSREAKKVVSLVLCEVDAPISYYVVDKICGRMKLPTPPLNQVIEKIRSMGFKAVKTHFHSRGIKTDAPSSIVFEAVKKAVENAYNA